MKNFKSLRENLISRLVSKGVKYTTPKRKPFVKEELKIQSSQPPETAELNVDKKSQPAGKANLKATPDMLKGKLTKEGRADDAFADLDKEVAKTKPSYMDKDKGATASGSTDKDYSDNKPATSSGTTNKSYMDSNPATPPSNSSSGTSSVRKTTKWKDLPDTDKEQWRRDRKAAGMPPIEEELSEVAAWQRKEGKNPEGGLNRKGVESYRRENPGSKLQMAVTTKPSKLKKDSKAANRRKSFCARMGGMKKKLTSAKTARDPDSRINKALRKWNC